MEYSQFRTHIGDLIVGLIDASWLPRPPPELAARRKQILAHPRRTYLARCIE